MFSGSKLNWPSIVGNLAIIAGLVLVAIELKQNSDIAEAQLLYEESMRMTTLEYSLIGEGAAAVWAKSIEQPHKLTLTERRIMEAYYWTFLEQVRSARLLVDLGLLDEAAWRWRTANEVSFFFGNDYGRAWWSAFSAGGGFLSPGVYEVIDSYLLEEPQGTMDYMNRAMNNYREMAESRETVEDSEEP